MRRLPPLSFYVPLSRWVFSLISLRRIQRILSVLIKRPSLGPHFCIGEKLPLNSALAVIVLVVGGCAHKKMMQVFPPITLSDTQTKSNLVVGQVFFEDGNGDLLPGPNLQTLGLVSHSVSSGPVSVSQPDITLAEFLSAIGASGNSCEASFPSKKTFQTGDEAVDWFRVEQDKLVGTEVSLLLEDTTNEVVDQKSLEKLFKEERRKAAGKIPWASRDNQKPSEARGAMTVVQAIYAGQAVLRFRVSDKTDFPQTSEHFLGHRANSANETILTLMRITSACAAHAQVRELPDPGVEVAIAFPARMAKGVRLARFEKDRVLAVPQVETEIHLYEAPRLPHWSQKRDLRGQEPVWKVDTTNAKRFLHSADDLPKLDERSLFLKYCADDHCYAIITSPREFDSKGHSYNGAPYGCVVGHAGLWSSFKDLFQREIKQRELVLFFGRPPGNGTGADFYDSTSGIVRKAAPNDGTLPKVGPTTEVWVYEYDCRGESPNYCAIPKLALSASSDISKDLSVGSFPRARANGGASLWSPT
jgi:hypothetical protein